MALGHVYVQRHAALDDVVLLLGLWDFELHVTHVGVLHDGAELAFSTIIRDGQVRKAFGRLVRVASKTFRIVILNAVPVWAVFRNFIVVRCAAVPVPLLSEPPVVLEMTPIRLVSQKDVIVRAISSSDGYQRDL